MRKKFYIRERHSPQFDKPYYVPEGQLTIKEAKKKEEPFYGWHIMLAYNTEKEYKEAIEKFKADGFNVHD